MKKYSDTGLSTVVTKTSQLAEVLARKTEKEGVWLILNAAVPRKGAGLGVTRTSAFFDEDTETYVFSLHKNCKNQTLRPRVRKANAGKATAVEGTITFIYSKRWSGILKAWGVDALKQRVKFVSSKRKKGKFSKKRKTSEVIVQTLDATALQAAMRSVDIRHKVS